MFLIVANPMVKRLPLPERVTSQFKDFVDFARRETLPALHDLTHRIVWHRPKNNVNMVGHDYPRIQSIAFAIEELQSSRGQIRDIGSPEPTTPLTFVEKAFQFPEIVAFNLLKRVIRFDGF